MRLSLFHCEKWIFSQEECGFDYGKRGFRYEDVWRITISPWKMRTSPRMMIRLWKMCLWPTVPWSQKDRVGQSHWGVPRAQPFRGLLGRSPCVGAHALGLEFRCFWPPMIPRWCFFTPAVVWWQQSSRKELFFLQHGEFFSRFDHRKVVSPQL